MKLKNRISVLLLSLFLAFGLGACQKKTGLPKVSRQKLRLRHLLSHHRKVYQQIIFPSTRIRCMWNWTAISPILHPKI